MTTPGFTPTSPAPTGTTGPQPLGVPVGYKAKLHGVPAPSPFAVAGLFGATVPPYTKNVEQFGFDPYAGTQYTLTDAINAGQTDPQTIYELQLRLVDAGLLKATSIRPGVWDNTTQAAYAQVLDFANKYALNAQQALAVYVQNPKLSKGPAYVDPVFTNPADVQTGFQNVSQNLTGQEMPTEQFQSYYHGQEAKTGHTAGTSYTQAPSVQGAATQYLINNDPSQVQAYGAASRMQELYSMLGVH